MISEEEFLAQAKKRYQAIAKLSNIKSYTMITKRLLIKYGRTMVERF